MQATTAVELLNTGMIYPPDVQITAEDWTHRFEDSVRITVNLPGAKYSDRQYAPDYSVDNTTGTQAFVVPVGTCDIFSLAGCVLDLIGRVREHEDREFLRLRSTGWAPFHPHKTDGINRWAERTGRSPALDYDYGSA